MAPAAALAASGWSWARALMAATPMVLETKPVAKPATIKPRRAPISHAAQYPAALSPIITSSSRQKAKGLNTPIGPIMRLGRNGSTVSAARKISPSCASCRVMPACFAPGLPGGVAGLRVKAPAFCRGPCRRP